MCHKIICDQYFFSLDRSHRKQHVDKEQVLERAQELLVEKMSLVEDDE